MYSNRITGEKVYETAIGCNMSKRLNTHTVSAVSLTEFYLSLSNMNLS